MNKVLLLSAALVVGGRWLALLTGIVLVFAQARPRRSTRADIRPILLMVLVELRSGASVLSSLHAAASQFPAERELAIATRVATVSGLTAARDFATGKVKLLLTHLARAQVTGASAADAVRRMLDSDIALERTRRLARTRALPVRLMLPVTLLMLPGVVLIGYGPTLVGLVNELAIPFG